jgi:hypothetical protein
LTQSELKTAGAPCTCDSKFFVIFSLHMPGKNEILEIERNTVLAQFARDAEQKLYFGVHLTRPTRVAILSLYNLLVRQTLGCLWI